MSSARRKLRGSNLNITDGYFIFASEDGGGFYKRVNASTDITSAFTRQGERKKKKKRIVGAAAKGNSVNVDILFTLV